MIAELMRVLRSTTRKKTDYPGESVISNAQGFRGDVNEAEIYALPGVTVVPPEGSNLVFVPLGGNRKAGVCIAGHNYQIQIEASQGETVIYSTAADGKTVQAQIKLDASGNINLNGDSKRLVTYAELNAAKNAFMTALNAHTHSGVTTGSGVSGPPASPMSLDISSSETQTVRTGG